MCFPILGLFNNNYCGRPMNMAYDMIHGGLAGSMNLMYNAAMEHMSVFPSLYTMPQDTFNFTPYGSMSGNMDYLLNPLFPVFQAQMGIGAGAGTVPGMTGDMQTMWQQMFGIGTGTGAGTADAATTRKYNKMLSLLKNLANSKDIPQDIKDEISDAIRTSKGTLSEKLDKLNTIYNKIDKADLIKALKNADNIGYSGTSTNVGDSFKLNLEALGFEYTDGTMDDMIIDIHSKIKEISDEQPNPLPLAGIVTKDNVLDMISSWNSQYASSSDEDSRRILSYIAKYQDKAADNGETVRGNMVDPLINALKQKANAVKTGLPKTEKSKIEAIINELNQACEDSTEDVSEEMITAFDKLYVAVRMAALAKFNSEVTEYYGELDEDLFNAELFTEETIEDLKEEGFDVDNVGNDDDDDVSGTDNDDDDDADVDETEGDDEVSGSGSALNKETTSTKALALSLFRDLNGYTTDSDWSNILLTMDSVNSENVLAVLKEFNRRGDKDLWSWGCSAGLIGHDQGFFEWVDRESGHATDRIKVQEEILGEVIKALEKAQKGMSKENKEVIKTYVKNLKEQEDKIEDGGFNAMYVDKIVASAITMIVQ